ncbi:MAG: hypothetical protein Q8R92_08470 [Deltaproteobacteria bacterium]|nr:hypothetical protein [Deltaproteobacteria bacterium]
MTALNRIRADLEGYLREAEAITYRNHAGLSEEAGLASLHARHPLVFDPESLRAVEEALAAAGSEDAGTAGGAKASERFRLELLRETLAQTAVEKETDAVSDGILEAEAGAEVAEPGGKLPYRSVGAAISAEPVRARRQALEAGRAGVLRELEPRYRAWWDRTREGCQAIGRADLAALVSDTALVDLDALAAEAAAFLRATEDLYRDYLGWLAGKRLGLKPGELESHDLHHLFYLPESRATYSSRNLTDLARRSMGEMNLSLEADGRISLDVEARPGKSSRAFCARLAVPSRIVLVIYPRGGVDDYQAFFHELGHAQHFAHTDPGLPFELRDLDDSAVTEAWAFTLQSLPEDPGWVAALLGEKPGSDFFRTLKLAKLFLVRRYAAKIAYELSLWRAEKLEDYPARYQEALQQATSARYPREGYLADVDPFFYVARYLRGWMLASQISEALRERFDEGWFCRGDTGTWLREQWRVGAIRAETLSATLGAPRLDAAALTREFLAAF